MSTPTPDPATSGLPSTLSRERLRLRKSCNWYWGSHGCELLPGHDGNHLCGTHEDPCSRHDGTRIQSSAWLDAIPRDEWHEDWEHRWKDYLGFCSRNHVGGGPCGDPEHCARGHGSR